VSVPDTPSYGRAIGVDVGLNDFLATSDGLKIPRPKFFVDLQRQLKLLQRRVSRKQKRSVNLEKAQVKVARLHHKIDNTRTYWQLKVAHQLCDQADSIFGEDIDYRVMRSWFLGKHSLAESWRCRLPSRQTFQDDASFGQFRELLKWVCWKRKVGGVGFRPAKLFKKRGKFFATVDHRGTSKQCPECGSEWDNNLSIRWHTCTECGYSNNRDIASAEVIRNRGTNKYPRTNEVRSVKCEVRSRN
jgi:putative transposase